MTSVLYDLPGPRAIMRNRILGVVTVLLLAGIVGFIVWRFAVSGQFAANRWVVFTFPAVWMSILKALGMTLAAFASAAVGSLLLGFILAMGRLSDHAWVRVPVTAIIELLRAVPVLIMMSLLFYGMPTVGVKVPPYVAVVVALIAYNGSVLAEALRSGIESLPRGQKEAGYAIGLRKNGVMTLVLLPQAVRAMLPVIIAQLVVTLKDTALGFMITYPELLYYAKQLMSHPSRPILQSALVIGSIYIILCLLLSWVANRVQKQQQRRQLALAESAGGTGGNPALQHEGTETELIVAQTPESIRRQRRDS